MSRSNSPKKRRKGRRTACTASSTCHFSVDRVSPSVMSTRAKSTGAGQRLRRSSKLSRQSTMLRTRAMNPAATADFAQNRSWSPGGANHLPKAVRRVGRTACTEEEDSSIDQQFLVAGNAFLACPLPRVDHGQATAPSGLASGRAGHAGAACSRGDQRKQEQRPS
jgi:hypothetical protein